MGISSLVRKVQQINDVVAYNKKLLEEKKRLTNTTAKYGTYSRGKVFIDGTRYDAVCASKDIILVDGCSVFCLPSENGYVIIGGGV